MYVEKDYILRLIHEICRMLIVLLSGKDSGQEKDVSFSLENEEDYQTQHDFSREEILEGIKYVADFYGYGNVVETLIREID